jgi:predicted nicotinamide N-methyase
VTATDIDEEGILDQIRRNISINSHLIKSPASIEVAPLNFLDDISILHSNSFNLILAGDIIYDDVITAAFVGFMDTVAARAEETEGNPVTMIIATEKRYVFTLAELDTVAPAYDFFLHQLAELMQKRKRMHLEFLNTDFEQYFCYERSKEMILIRLTF